MTEDLVLQMPLPEGVTRLDQWLSARKADALCMGLASALHGGYVRVWEPSFVVEKQAVPRVSC